MELYTETLILGAGPSGLASAAYLTSFSLPYVLLEQSDKIAIKWHQHYDRLHLHTVKSESYLPFMPFPENYPQYISKNQLIEYYNSYAEKYAIKPRFNTQVDKIEKVKDEWLVHCRQGDVYRVKNLIIAAGLNRVPNTIDLKGREHFNGEIIHASAYKNAKAFLGKKVLVVGMGNTGAEIALDLAEHKIDVAISIRKDVVIIPRDFLGRPVQLTAKKLSVLPFGIGDWIGSMSSKIAFGNLKNYGLPISNIYPAVFRKKHGRAPTIDIGTVEKIKSGDIKICKDIAQLNGSKVEFVDKTLANIDVIILATGYHTKLEELLSNTKDILNSNAEPILSLDQQRAMGLYFIGYDKYTLGGTLGTLIKESKEIAESIYKNTIAN